MAIEKWSDRIIIVHLSGDPDLGENIQAAGDEVAQRSVDVVLDFGAIRYVSSSHIGRLLKLRKTVLSAGSRWALCAVDTQVWGASLVTRLDKIFDFNDSAPPALAALQLARP